LSARRQIGSCGVACDRLFDNNVRLSSPHAVYGLNLIHYQLVEFFLVIASSFFAVGRLMPTALAALSSALPLEKFFPGSIFLPASIRSLARAASMRFSSLNSRPFCSRVFTRWRLDSMMSCSAWKSLPPNVIARMRKSLPGVLEATWPLVQGFSFPGCHRIYHPSHETDPSSQEGMPNAFQ
jgi:hypothetical protein